LGQSFSWAQAGAALLTCGAAYGLTQVISSQRAQPRATTEQEQTGKPKLGGPFTLIGPGGTAVTSEDLKGKFLLLYFGFTFCPDICPSELIKQQEVIEALDAALGKRVDPVFVSIDPARDTIAQVQNYCAEFGGRLLGLTGTPDQVKTITRAYRVYFNQGIKVADDSQDYLIDHSIIHYLVGPDGSFVDFYGKNLAVKEMVAKIKEKVEEREARKENRRGVADA
jgi:protein SCO1/2